MNGLALQLFLPVTGMDGGWFWLSLVIVPIVMAMIRFEDKPKLRRILAALCFAIGLAAVMVASGDDVVIPHGCVVCLQMEPGSWERWFCELINGVC